VSAEPWLVALDLDGTVLHEDETLDEAVVVAARAARDRGHEVMLATGRSWRTTEPVLRSLGLSPEYVVCANGAVTMRRSGESFGEEAGGPAPEPRYVRAHVETFDPTEVLQRIRGHLPEGRFMVELEDARRLYTEDVGDWDLSNATRVPFEGMFGLEVTRIVVVSPGHDLQDFLRIVDGMGLHQVSYAIGWTAWLDIAPAGVNKATGLERVRAWLDWPQSRILAVGDGRNDIEMFRWAGVAGRAVAMGQAPAEVRAAANELTAPVAEAGLVPVLDSLP